MNTREMYACVMRGKFYVVGGVDAGENVVPVKEIECYDPVNDAWSIVENAIDISYHHTLVVS